MEDIRYNNLEVVRFINHPVPSNTFLLVDRTRQCCVAIDPGSKTPIELERYLQENNLQLDYILLTHEHFDHCWGVRYLVDATDTKVVATRKCRDWLKIPMNYFNKLYYDSDEFYSIDRVDIIVEDIGMSLEWNDRLIHFIETKGHTDKSMCISIEDKLFTGDTIIKDTKPVIKKKYGASLTDLKESISRLFSLYSPQTKVYAGHGDFFFLWEMKSFYIKYFEDKKINSAYINENT